MDAACTAVAAQHLDFEVPRPNVAIISNGQTPYGIHACLRVAREIPEIRLFTLFTHDISMAPWCLALPPELTVIRFGKGEHARNQYRPRYLLHEWSKGGRVIAWLDAHHVRAVIMLGYNDPGRLRILRWCQRHNVACFIWGDSNIRGDSNTGPKAWLKQTLLPLVLARCTGVMPCGQFGQAYFAKYGVSADRMFLFPNEPDYAAIRSASPDQLAQIRSQFHLDPRRRWIVFSGRLVDVKRVDLLLDAFARIADRRPEWNLVVVGDGPLRQPLHDRVPLPLRPRVVWTGFVNQPEVMAAIYRACDVLVLPSDFEPWALVLNEAAAANLAIVCTDVVGAAPELVCDRMNGRTFPPGDLSALVACLLEVTDPTRIDTMKAASASVLSDWQRRADPVEGVRQALRFCGLLPSRQLQS